MKPSHGKIWENSILNKGIRYWIASDMSGILNAEETEEPVVSAEVEAREISKHSMKIEHRAWSQKASIKSWLHCCVTLGNLFKFL